MLGLGKLQVLESKIDIYEDLSKEMLDKLERAVTTISENSNKIAVVLERHENRLDESDRSDKIIIKMIEELRTENRRDHQKTSDRIDKIQRKVDQNQKFVIGVSAVLATLVTVLQVIPPIAKLLTEASNSAIVSEGNVSLNESLRRSVHQSNSFST